MTKENEKKVPKLRFKGFTDDWEQRKLGDSLKVLDGDRGINYPHESDFFQSGDTLFLNTGNVTKNGFNFNTVKYITKEKDELLRAGRLEENDFVLTSRGTLGNIGFYDHKIYKDYPKVRINSAMLILRNVDKQLSYSYLHSVLKGKLISDFMKKNQVGSAQPHITKTEFLKLNLSIPENIKEQNKIGSFFNNFDKNITLHQRKLEQLEKLKQALLQQMFAQKDENVPRLRFANFAGVWEQCRVKDLFEVTRGKVLSTGAISQIPTEIYKYPVFSSQTQNNGLMGYYFEYLFETAITWTTDGANAGTVNFRKGKFYSTNVNGVLLSNDGYANKCIAEIINQVAWKNVSKVGNPKLMNNIMSNIVIKIPTLEEQYHISNLFDKLDVTIALHHLKLDQLKLLKKELLRQMFI